MKGKTKRLVSVLTAVGMLFMCLLGGTTQASADEALSNLVDGWPKMRDINEQSGLVVDADGGGVIYSLNRDATRYPASTTKVLTALLVIENASLDDIVTMTNTGVQMAISGSTNANTKEGEQFTVEQCLYMLMLKSANDIANQLAEHVAGSMDAFVGMMNDRARELGCTGTNFRNPSGMPDSEHYTTPADMALIVNAAIKNETFVRIAQAESVTIPPTNKTSENRVYTNHNALVVKDSGYYYEYCFAGKTGYTDSAWRTYVSAAKKDGRTLICVLMKGPDKNDFVDAKDLFEYGFNEFEKIDVPGGSVTLPKGMDISKTTDETEILGDGNRSVSFYYNKLPVGRAVMTEAEYCVMRGLPVPETAVSDAAAVSSAEAPAENGDESGSAEVKEKSSRRAGWLIPVIVIVLLCALGLGGAIFYMEYKERKEREEKRRKIMERRRQKREEENKE
ncbi:MAG: D-alanyl-D-alanine carboxypeptidase family protein [Lachnospiraceae bacterium]|nr:D-alanyl-D-alanine carboxypeptidase family protein [Lachnospiraceae bacterium]